MLVHRGLGPLLDNTFQLGEAFENSAVFTASMRNHTLQNKIAIGLDHSCNQRESRVMSMLQLLLSLFFNKQTKRPSRTNIETFRVHIVRVYRVTTGLLQKFANAGTAAVFAMETCLGRG